MNALLELKEVSIKYSKSAPWVLRDTSFSASAGEFIVLTGPSGGGKTTLLNILNGIIANPFSGVFEGDILFNGNSIANLPAAERSLLIGSILQNADEQIIFEKIEDELAFALENMQIESDLINERISKAAKMMKLDLNWATKTLSGGQKQRLIAATTLAMGQPVILLDEPLANLDKNGSELLLQKLKFLSKEKGYCVILIEHRLDWVFEIADKFCWIDESGIKTFSSGEIFKSFWQEKIKYALSNNCLLLQGSLCNSEYNSDCRVLIDLIKAGVKKNGRQILEDINFKLKQGDRWVVIGDNGAGKTSLLKLLTNIYKPNSGIRKTTIKTKDIFSKIGYVLQNPDYQLFMSTVRDEISYQSKSDELVSEIITLFELDDLLDRHPHSLSEGQKRRVGVAAVLAMQPEVLFLDEPTVGQDYNSLGNMIKAIAHIYRNKSLTMITLTHDTRCARYLGDKILWLDNGRIKSIGGHELLEKL